MSGFQRGATLVLSSLLLLAGIAILVETAVLGGTAGYLVGALFLVAGGGRLYLSGKR